MAVKAAAAPPVGSHVRAASKTRCCVLGRHGPKAARTRYATRMPRRRWLNAHCRDAELPCKAYLHAPTQLWALRLRWGAGHALCAAWHAQAPEGFLPGLARSLGVRGRICTTTHSPQLADWRACDLAPASGPRTCISAQHCPPLQQRSAPAPCPPARTCVYCMMMWRPNLLVVQRIALLTMMPTICVPFVPAG